MVVAPYNAQVRRLRAGLPSDIRVGTVDKFQGQQARRLSCCFRWRARAGKTSLAALNSCSLVIASTSRFPEPNVWLSSCAHRGSWRHIAGRSRRWRWRTRFAGLSQ